VSSETNEVPFSDHLLRAWRRISKTLYFRWAVGFVMLQAFFLFSVYANFVPGIAIEVQQTAFFIVSVNALMFANTYTFEKDVSPTLGLIEASESLNSDFRSFMDNNQVFRLALKVASGLSAVVAVVIVLKVAEVLTWNWETLLKASEYASVIVFLLFVIADGCCLETMVRAEHHNPPLEMAVKQRAGKLKRELQRYLLAVDIPGLIGIVLIVASTTVLKDSVQFLYWEGFVAGAVALHIMFSQMALLLLCAIDDQPNTKCV
jgi:hypothetical protein